MDKKNTIALTYKLKVINLEECGEQMKLLSKAYKDAYNELSAVIIGNLTTMNVGDLKPFSSSNKIDGYRSIPLLDENKDIPLYKMFLSKTKFAMLKQYDGHELKEGETLQDGYLKIVKNLDNESRYNIVFECFTKYIMDRLLSVPFINNTYMYREGVSKTVVANIMSHFSKVSTKIKRELVTEDSDNATLLSQLILENETVSKHHPNSKIKLAWKEEKEYLEDMYNNSNKMERFNILYKFLCSVPEKEIQDARDKILVGQINNMSVTRKSETITFNSIFKKGKTGNANKVKLHFGQEGTPTPNLDITLGSGDDAVVIKTSGHRKLFNPDGTAKFDLNDICESLTIQFKGNNAYANIVLEKEIADIEAKDGKCVGIDINVKHMMMVTSEKSGTFNETNVLARILSDETTYSLMKKKYGKQVMDSLKELSTHATFGYIGSDFLCASSRRRLPDATDEDWDDIRVSNEIDRVFGDMLKEATNEEDKFYIGSNRKLRHLIINQYRWKRVYMSKKSKYQEGWSNDEQRDRALEFNNTEEGTRLMEILTGIIDKIKGCRNDIIHYAYNKIMAQGEYSTIGLENLDSSNFNKRQTCAHPNSLLFGEKHMMHMKPMSELDNDKAYANKKDYYEVETDANGNVTNIIMSKVGERMNDQALFFNNVIKAISFASIKDELSKLSSFRNLKTVYAASMYTSQMNSKKHTMYTTRNSSGNEVIAQKKHVRIGQERHINGMNADVNSSINIRYMASEPSMVEKGFMKPVAKWEYGKPIKVAAINSQAAFLKKVKTLEMTEPIPGKEQNCELLKTKKGQKSLKQNKL